MSRATEQKSVLLAMGPHYIDRMHRGIAQYAGQNGWHLTNLFGNTPELIQQRECDGIIAVLSSNDPLSDAVIQRKKPTVNLSITRHRLKMPHLTGDNEQMGRSAAQHFLGRGFQRFLWFSENSSPAAQLRLRGYRSELESNGFECATLIVSEAFQSSPPNWRTLRTWIQETLQKRGFPCAVYAFKDSQAVNLLDACIACGFRVPEEVAVLGTDNHPLICPTAAVPLSSINHDLEEFGRRAAAELDLIMRGAPSKNRIIEIPHQGITVRQSTNVFAINDTHVVKALHFINNHFQNPINVADIVKATGLSRRALERRFQEHLKLSILGKLNQHRLDHICRLLRESAMPIADIAAQSGFNTPEYLHRVFQKQIGTTPRKYRLSKKSEFASPEHDNNERPD
ncbi:DNA-binding transcriptional regulator [Pelagicoccus sp. SDUM812003]|uniref:AraC family transcriptional regulator n=1 Tax=Pelagicoccus sp. SDUM812003 TaxID=3041267 RepID=UPI00280F8136|nr:DNA-binding transcriptional regulator [Pelagicoccus sp. SDUM812003]MDQ8201406.1 DNA-binding transcriptional regulator [Pelagicoccus sp. SDUM812003]